MKWKEENLTSETRKQATCCTAKDKTHGEKHPPRRERSGEERGVGVFSKGARDEIGGR